MIFNPETHHILAAHLERVRVVLQESSHGLSEIDGITDDLATQIDAMIGEVEGEITAEKQQRILEQLDPPESYRMESPPCDDVPAPHPPTKPLSFPLGKIALALSALLLAFCIFKLNEVRNRIIEAEEFVDSSFAQVETVLQRRFDLIPNLVETVKGYAKQEKGVLSEVTRLRSQWAEAKTPEARVSAANGMESALSRLMVISESYPDLKSNEGFTNLQFQLEGTENRISIERNRYNAAVQHYNSSARKFPGSLFRFRPRQAYFESTEGADVVPKVSF